MHRRKLLLLLDDYAARAPVELPTVQRFLALAEAHDNCFANDCWAGHVTGSAWVMHPYRDEVLLTHHRKLDIWVQLGGHSDGDPDTCAVAAREAREESGLDVAPLGTSVFDLDIHEIPARKGDPAHWHYDVRFAFRALTEEFVVSPESKDLAWVPVQRMDDYTHEESMHRMARKWLSGWAPSA
ncbi:MAG: NUDIX hydrolase [Pseudomonadales bacterium]